MSRREEVWQIIWRCLTAFFMAAGLSLMYVRAFVGPGLEGLCLAASAVTALGLEALNGCLKGRWKLTLLLIPVFEAVLYLTGRGMAREWVQAVMAKILEMRGVEEASAPYRGDLAVLMSVVLSLCCVALAEEESFSLAASALAALMALPALASPVQAMLLYAAAPIAGLMMIAAAGQGRKWPGLVLSVLIPLAAYLLLPPAGTVQQDMKDFAQSVRDHTADYLFFNEERDAFSMADAGYQPLTTRLGGRAEPDPSPVMEVTGQPGETLYLRARAYDFYDGLNWSDSLSGPRHLYEGFSFLGNQGLRDELFQTDYPLTGKKNAAREVTVTMLSAGPTTVYAPWHTESFEGRGDRMVLYFNDGTELFITRNFEAGDEYTLTYIPYTAGESATDDLISLNDGLTDPAYAQALASYCTRPDHIQQEVFDMAQRAAAGQTDPYHRALAIRDWLKTHYSYTLEAADPPDNVDFVAWFLLSGEEGYCTYFASAMTVMCRMVGIPARYTVGYRAVLDGEGHATVTGAQAHAWTEIYLNGFGWLTLDATPGEGGSGSTQSNDPPPQNEPTPSPEPEGEDDSPDGGETEPEPSEEAADPAATPTPPPEEAAVPPEGGTPPEEESEPDENNWLFPLLVLLLLAALILWRLYVTDPRRRAQKHPDEGAEILYTASLHLLKEKGEKKADGETLLEYGDRMADKYGLTEISSGLMDLCACRYGTARSGQMALAERCYAGVKEKAGKWAAFKAAVRRMIKAPKVY